MKLVRQVTRSKNNRKTVGHLRAFRTGVIPYPGVQYCEESGEFSQFFKEIITLKISANS